MSGRIFYDFFFVLFSISHREDVYPNDVEKKVNEVLMKKLPFFFFFFFLV